MKIESFAPGNFCWAELMTTDAAGAKKFYTALLGCDYTDIPMGPDGVYTIMNVNGESTGAMYEDKSGQKPVAWGTYINVEDVEASAAKAKELGGTVIAGPFDVMTAGRMAVIQDPTGAFFNLWQAGTTKGYSLAFEPGAVCWNELRSGNTAAAEAFYAGLFGYGIKHSEMSGPYTEFQLEGKSIAGMYAIGPNETNVPPHWLVIFTVAKCAESIEVAKNAGGTLVMGPMTVPGVGDFAVLIDPQGGVFGVVD